MVHKAKNMKINFKKPLKGILTVHKSEKRPYNHNT